MNKKRRSIKMILCLGVMSGLTFASVASANMSFSKASKKGGLVGNGGGTVVCRDDGHKIKTIQLLDYYESTLHPGMKLDIQKFSGDWKSKATAIIDRIRTKSEMRFQLYSKWLAKFESERLLLEGVQFSTVADSGYIGVPIGCAFEQAAIQRRPNFSEDPRYFINSELWSAMDDNQKAGLVLHEMIYREAIGYGHTDSIRARYLTGLYSSEGFGAQTLEQYWKVLDQAHFELVDVKVKDSLKGSITSFLDTKRLWQAAPDEKDVPSAIPLEDVILVSLGKCAPGDCNSFESRLESVTRFAKPQALDNLPKPSVMLPKELSNLKVGDTSFFSLSLLPIDDGNATSNNLGDVRFSWGLDGAAKDWISFDAELKNFFGMTEKNGRTISNATQLRLEKIAGDSWQWASATAGSIFDHHIPAPNGFNFGRLVAQSSGRCLIPYAVYKDNELYSIGTQRVIHNGAVLMGCDEQIQVSDQLANGSATIYLDQTSENLLFDHEHLGRLQELPTSQAGWSAPHTAVNCPSKNCMIPTLVDDASVSSLIVLDESPSMALGCYANPNGSDIPDAGYSSPFCAAAVLVKTGTRIELHANGSPKSFIVGKAAMLDIPSHPPASLAAGSAVELDDQGNIISVH